jgi:hypothetical protein
VRSMVPSPSHAGQTSVNSTRPPHAGHRFSAPRSRQEAHRYCVRPSWRHLSHRPWSGAPQGVDH